MAFIARRNRLLTSTLLAALTLPGWGCATQPRHVADNVPLQPVFYPAPPDEPRLQFLTSYRQPQLWDDKAQSSLATWLVGHGPPQGDVTARFVSPYGLTLHQGKLYVCDVGSSRVHVIDMVRKVYGTLPGEFVAPVNITLDSDGRKYICDTGRRAILIFDVEDRQIGEISGPEGWSPIALAIHGDSFYVADIGNRCIQVLSRDGEPLRTISSGGQGPQELHGPTNLAIGPDERLYVSDTYQQMLKVFDLQGRFHGTIGGPGTAVGNFARPKGLAIDPSGYIYVADSQWEVVQIFNARGQLMLFFGGAGTDPFSMGMPAGLYIDRDHIEHFRQLMTPGFEPEYLLFVVNQFGINKVAVYAFGQYTPPQTAPALTP
jgi:hypothetical protein